MEIKQLTAVVTVAETGSVTRAAELLHIVQPAVTRQVRALEQELGVELFERSRTGMRPTAAGKAFVERARRILTELERARTEVRPPPGVVEGAVIVGLLESMTDLVAEPLVSEVSRLYPDIRLSVVSGYSGHLQRWLDEGDLDLTMLYNLRSTPALNVAPIARERLWAVGPSGAGLRAETAVDLAELVGRPLVLPGAGHGLRTLIDAAAKRARFKPTAAVETNSMQIQKSLVLAGHGWTILPAVAVAADIAAGVFSGAPLSDPQAFRDIVMAVPRALRVPPAVQAVAELLTSQLRHATRDGSWPSAIWQSPRLP